MTRMGELIRAAWTPVVQTRAGSGVSAASRAIALASPVRYGYGSGTSDPTGAERAGHTLEYGNEEVV